MIRKVMLWSIVGLLVGGLVGYISLREYIMDYTDDCVTAYNKLAVECNDMMFHCSPLARYNVTWGEIDGVDQGFG